jgi:hypothetical protein
MLGDKPRNHLCRLLSEFAEIHSNLTQVIRAKEFRPVEVDHVFWRLGNPNLGFPSDITGVFAETPSNREMPSHKPARPGSS